MEENKDPREIEGRLHQPTINSRVFIFFSENSCFGIYYLVFIFCHQTHASDPPQRPRKEKVLKHTEIDLAQVTSRQVQLEGMAEKTNQVVHTIKELLETIVFPQVQ